jgi:ABC-type sugar transport system substrate-binding protein
VAHLFAAVLRRVLAEVDRVASTRPSTVVLTHPAVWGPHRRELLASAAAAAGLGDVRLVPEPVAAAAYLVRMAGATVPIGGHAVVYDFGAGTFDATVLRRTVPGFEVLATRGLDDTGGLDIDAALVSSLGAVYRPRNPHLWQRLTEPATATDRRASAQLWTDVRTAKETLARLSATLVHLPLLDADAPVGRELLDEVARPVVDRTVEATRDVIRRAGLAPADVAGVFLVGGASRMPLAATRLHATLGLAAVVTEQPELVVAEGSLHVDPPEPESGEPPRVSLAKRSESAAPPVPWLPPPAGVPVSARPGRWRLPVAAVAAVLAVAATVLAVVLQYGDVAGMIRSTGGAQWAGPLTLGVVEPSLESPWRKAHAESIREAAAADGVTVTVVDAGSKMEAQIEAIRGFVAQKVDVIALSPVVTSGWDEVLREAKAAGIPVIALDSVLDIDLSLYRTVLESDSLRHGRLAASWVTGQANLTGFVSIAEIRARHWRISDRRAEAFAEALPGDGRFQIVASREGKFTHAGGTEAMRDILATNPGIDVVFAHNDDMAIGAVRAIEAAGLVPGTDIRIVSVDASRDAMIELAAGRINFILESSPLVGPQLMELARMVRAGTEVPFRVAVEEGSFDQSQAAAALPGRRY